MKCIKGNKYNLSLMKLQKQLNKLDKESTKAMERIVLKCRKLNMGRVPYFPGLAMKENCVTVWKVLRK